MGDDTITLAQDELLRNGLFHIPDVMAGGKCDDCAEEMREEVVIVIERVF